MVLGELVLRPIPTSWSRTASRSTPRRSASTTTSSASPAATRRARTGWRGWTSSATASSSTSASRRRRARGDAGRSAVPDAVRAGRRSTAELAARWARSQTSRRDPSGAPSGRCTTAAASPCPERRAARRVPRAARLRARARRLRHEPQGRARGLRVHRARRSRPEGLRVAGDADRAVRDGLHLEHRVLRPRRERTRDPGARHAPAHRRRDPAGQGGVRALRRRPVRSRLLRARGRPVGEVRDDARRPAEVVGRDRGRVGRPVRPRGHVGDASGEPPRDARESNA